MVGFCGPAENLSSLALKAEHVHLGDVILQTFRPPKPDGTSKTYQFNLNKIPSVFKIRINLKDVDPDARNGPLAFYINGAFVLYLNEYFSNIPPTEEHKAPWKLVTIEDFLSDDWDGNACECTTLAT